MPPSQKKSLTHKIKYVSSNGPTARRVATIHVILANCIMGFGLGRSNSSLVNKI